jgi:O-antigen ligase
MTRAPRLDAVTDSQRPSFANWMGSLWLYTILRFAMFFALWGLVLLAGLGGLFAAFLALVLSVPLSLVLLARPRARVAANLEQRVNAHRAARTQLDERLNPDGDE